MYFIEKKLDKFHRRANEGKKCTLLRVESKNWKGTEQIWIEMSITLKTASIFWAGFL